MQAFVPKNRRPKFELHLKIYDLNNVPLVSGTAYVKWHLAHSASADHRGRTPKSNIKDHKVQWEYERTIPVRMTVDKNSMLQECEICFEVLQEYAQGAKGERILLGNVKLNLAEYVDGDGAGAGEAGEGEEGTTRRYLMQDSRINSTLKISIAMKQIEGDRNFFAPPLKSAPVFGGIAGIMSNEQTEQDDLGHINPMNFKPTENRELHDMYRRTLAASFAAQAGELPADECIESIFAGGDGWRDINEINKFPTNSTNERDRRRTTPGVDSSPHTQQPGFFRPNKIDPNARRRNFRSSDESHDSRTGVGVGGSLDMSEHPDAKGGRSRCQVDEFEVRENLRSWRLPLSG
ncbi:MAG: hypothetical protein M1816_004415 [Peltula sp. TS41687]|nr:MAG: hypothetical protein M1816_004415 [Peltula sp. TS41687]